MRIGHDTLPGRLLRLPLRLIPKHAVVPVLTGINRGRKWRVGASIHGCWLGTYELDKQRLMARLIKPGMVAWDIGANAGFYTLAMSRLVGPEGRVHAFEPPPENISNVVEHLKLNVCRNVTVHQLAMSDRSGEATFRTASSNAMGHLSPEGNLCVRTAAADKVIAEGKSAVPDIVKMDVEGAEALLLRGAEGLLGMRKTIWVVALHGDEQRREVGRILAGHGYRIFGLSGDAILDDIGTDEIYALPGR